MVKHSASTTSPIEEVAARAGVSIATVSRVVNNVPNKASAATVGRVRAAVAELCYRPVSAGRALRERRSRMVAVLAPNLANPTMSAMLASIETALRGSDLVTVACDTHDDPTIQDEYLLAMRAQRVRATVLLGAVESPQLDVLSSSGESLIFVGRRRPGARPCTFIGIDNQRAGAEAAAFFLQRDLKVLGVLHGATGSSATSDRIEGFRSHFEESGRTIGAGFFLTLSNVSHMEIGYQCALELTAGHRGPAGIFCSSDLIAYGAHRAFVTKGIGAEVILLGVDDNPLNDWIAPWLSSIRIPYEKVGAAVAGAIERLDAGKGPDDTILSHHLVVRGG